jgi:hypothetical protein
MFLAAAANSTTKNNAIKGMRFFIAFCEGVARMLNMVVMRREMV